MTFDDPMPELDERFSEPGATPTPWADVVEVFERAELFWISTVRADGRPHVTPLPAVWHGGALHLCTGPEEQKARNLARNRSCILTTGTNTWKAGLDVVVEGEAVRITDDERLRVLAGLWFAKYGGDWRFEASDGVFHHPDGGVAEVFAVQPVKVLAFAKGAFAQTRFRPTVPAGAVR